ncbi:hypothetical protein [Pampinifervens florentissimum]|uniref:hypothetical protein n=1 Tax=Pampinifervens florentissimum TaxID=1632019 RepID=UPI0013B49D4B|nr:hypothetical protein [Hydrogenobacter sp. T-8]QID33056.1 hypothetical protein G3M65_04450 [Hydrogenobacter sp. T-8]
MGIGVLPPAFIRSLPEIFLIEAFHLLRNFRREVLRLKRAVVPPIGSFTAPFVMKKHRVLFCTPVALYESHYKNFFTLLKNSALNKVITGRILRFVKNWGWDCGKLYHGILLPR